MSSAKAQSPNKPSILAQACRDDAIRYLDRHAYADMPELAPADPQLSLVLVIPAMAEPDVVQPLASVYSAQRPQCAVEIIVVINAPDDADKQMRQLTASSLASAKAWAARHSEQGFQCHVLDYSDLPAQHASVGLARKLGMDVALTRLVATDSAVGAIACLDADCRVDVNYLQAIEQAYRTHHEMVGATVYFEHPLDDTEAELRSAIIAYEMHLRCYKQGLQAAGSAYARHTVGSAFTVRSDIYAQEGGMNRRVAGEDFYFINKLMKRGMVGEINNATVYPSARLSRRVPFGTGAAMWQRQSSEQLTYSPESYLKLQEFRCALFDLAVQQKDMPAEYASFVEASSFAGWLQKMQANVASKSAMQTQLLRWLDGFREMKFLNWLSESRNPKIPVMTAAQEILQWLDQPSIGDAHAMLEMLRLQDRNG